MDKIKILYVITALNIGGAEMMLYRMLGSMDRDRFELMVVSLMDKGKVGEVIESDLGVAVNQLDIKTFIEIFAGIRTLGNIIKIWAPQIVHSHMVHANLITRVTRVFYGFPRLVCTIHNIEEKGKWKSSKLRLLLYRLTDPLCDLSTHVSLSGYKKYIAIKAAPKEKIIHMPNGVDTTAFKANARKTAALRKELELGDCITVLAVGSLTKQKDYPTMLKSFSIVIETIPTAVLLIAGGGLLEKELHNLVIQYNLTDNVRFLGIRSDIPVIMSLADVFVMSSAWEGLPIVLLEAAASKLPIIATDVGGNCEVVINNESGFW